MIHLPTSTTPTGDGTTSWFTLTDSHCHLKLDINTRRSTSPASSGHVPFVCGIKRAVICGTHPDIDWGLIEDVATSPPTLDVQSVSESEESWSGAIIPGFGIHPWFVPYAEEGKEGTACVTNGKEEREEGSTSACRCCCHANATSTNVVRRSPRELLDLLERALERFPQAIVGEIGLDKLRGPPEPVQLELFLGQMKLAARYGRPVSVHCVRSFGTMLSALQQLAFEDTPPSIVLHGFTGSLDFVRSAIKIQKRGPFVIGTGSRSKPKARPLRIFFGVGAATSFRVKGFVDKVLPFLLKEGRALLETDAHHIFARSNDTTPTFVPSPGRSPRVPSASGGGVERHEQRRCVQRLEVLGCEQLGQLLWLASDGDIRVARDIVEGCERTCKDVFSFAGVLPGV
ncbi:TatD related DNase, putative [Trypanosoma equiperdum]|uniref:TatD related DNase, putative n=1 Tax=Trypanosoma equiperdum TaxID=5694 RepID=A0A1G4IJR1_TRYEQ|nr:TatD related DNase, putative [Trypanosoma equiperdum]